jgi:hypothetical protein
MSVEYLPADPNLAVTPDVAIEFINSLIHDVEYLFPHYSSTEVDDYILSIMQITLHTRYARH